MTETEKMPQVRHNEDRSRFEAATPAGTAVVEYRRHGDRITFTHTEVPPAMRGRGIADDVAEHALEYAAAERLEVVPACPFIAAYIRRHPKYAALVRAADDTARG